MKTIFNFYLDDLDKTLIIDKIERLNGKREKGQLASFLRASIRKFIETPDDEVDKEFLKKILEDYTVNTNCNKRSIM